MNIKFNTFKELIKVSLITCAVLYRHKSLDELVEVVLHDVIRYAVATRGPLFPSGY